MRPMLAMFLGENLRSRFSRSRNSQNRASQKLSHQKIDSKGANGGNHRVEGWKPRGWYSATMSALVTHDKDRPRGSEEEEMVPIGKIGVKHALEWREDHELRS